MPDVNAKSAVTRRLGPDEHAVWIACIFRDVRFQPLDQRRHIPPAVVPVRTGMTLHRNGHHVVLHSPASDVVVERVGLPILLLDFVAASAWKIDEDRTVST